MGLLPVNDNDEFNQIILLNGVDFLVDLQVLLAKGETLYTFTYVR